MESENKQEPNQALLPVEAENKHDCEKLPLIGPHQFETGQVVSEPEPKQSMCCCCCASPFKPPPPVDSFCPGSQVIREIAVRRVYVVLNPFGGNGRAPAAWAKAKKVLDKAEVKYEVFETECQGHATAQLAKCDLNGFDAICILGGDGTISECVRGLFLRKDGHKLPLCLIAGGTGNSVNVSLDNMDPERSAQNLVAGRLRPMDVIRVTEEEGNKGTFFSINIVAWGASADASKQAEKLRCFGQCRYDCAGLCVMCRNKTHPLRIEIDGGKWVMERDDFFTLFVQNNQHCGVKLRVCPYARVDDGYMDVVSLPRTARCRSLKLFNAVKKKAIHVFYPDVKYFRCKTLRLITPRSEILNVDGDIVGTTPCLLETLSGALEVFCEEPLL